MTLAAGVTALALLWLVTLLLTSPRTRPPAPRPTPRFQSPSQRTVKAGEEQWTRTLLAMTRGNVGAIERGVNAKRRKFLRATRAELLEMLHDDVRDRR
ncbi:hypothetical protein [Deinococcus petrolearius]|uniref:Uncharacterized protein n=1 Tax=Deinococcus petrolearius TaxID=1751295 RepID=A0ABW1DN71_9DEIO